MSIKDKQKWDSKYIKKANLLEPRNASQNLQNFIKECKGKKALDIACGAGRNSIYLAKNGFDVDALDIAKIALDSLENYASNQGLSKLINTQLIDLDGYAPEVNRYDLVIMANFLDRSLIYKLKDAIKVDGIFIVETYMQDLENEKTNSNPKNLLKENELKEIFQSPWETIFYNEFENEAFEIYNMKKQVIVAKKSLMDKLH